MVKWGIICESQNGKSKSKDRIKCHVHLKLDEYASLSIERTDHQRYGQENRCSMADGTVAVVFVGAARGCWVAVRCSDATTADQVSTTNRTIRRISTVSRSEHGFLLARQSPKIEGGDCTHVTTDEARVGNTSTRGVIRTTAGTGSAITYDATDAIGCGDQC